MKQPDNHNFFFITSYDNISGTLLGSLINTHPDIHCSIWNKKITLANNHLYDKHQPSDEIDKFLLADKHPSKPFNGNIQRYSAYELQHKILAEKVITPARRINLAINPKLRINFLINDWLQKSSNTSLALYNIEKMLNVLESTNDRLYELYHFDYFYKHIIKTATSYKINLDIPENKLFILALTYIVTLDTADLLTPVRTYSFEKIMESKDTLHEFLNYITKNEVIYNDSIEMALSKKRTEISQTMHMLHNQEWKEWKTQLLNNYLSLQLKTIYYPHINIPLADHYTRLGYKLSACIKHQSFYSKLISIQLNSNRPAQLSHYFDNIEETAAHPEAIEVLVNIDIGDVAMEDLLKQEIKKRKFTIKYIITERPKSFCDLWKPINSLLDITDKNAYFLLNISDEMLFATKHWDLVLKKYVGYFPDHLFRLRASRNQLRNYFDRWECSFAQDSIPITTKRWVDIGGDWNPCFGPDSFQQLISFYLTQEGKFSSSNYSRELPVIDIKFHGDVPGLGISSLKAWKHNCDHIKAMQICQSYPMQLEARRRAMLIKANIIAATKQYDQYSIIDVKNKRQIHLINKGTNNVTKIDYKINRFWICLINQIRIFHFNAYFGGGKESSRNIIIDFLSYLKSKNVYLHHLYLKIISFSFLKTIKKIIYLQRNKKNLKQEYIKLKELYATISIENEILNNRIANQHAKNVVKPESES